LVIDDFLDESELRNGLPSVYLSVGAKKATCIGTILSSHAFALISSELAASKRLVNGPAFLQCVSQGHAEVYAGQLADLEGERNVALTEQKSIHIIELTTASLLRASLVGGAILWGARSDVIEILGDIGRNLGIAYQIRDDVVDIIGDSELIGKPVGGDLERCKVRLPAIYALEILNGRARQKLLRALSGRVEDAGELRQALSLVESSGAVQHCIQTTKRFCDRAVLLTKRLPPSHGRLKNELQFILKLISSFP
jgi:geranylgeranyl pyrophosphate synthase